MRRIALLMLVLVLAACGGEEEASPPTTTVAGAAATTPEEDATTSQPEESGPVVVIQTPSGEVLVPVEVADSPEERQMGLMNRESLAEDAGMVFLFGEATTSGFWMKDTLIPLSIAFADADGVILRVLDMEPCETDPCEVYDPGVPYWSALEVNQGAFSRWGVEEGDRLRLEG
ncbi:MAG TPA: DUF192 domain-containing protein [Gaiellaceae bacterium]|nr:DUF192 domain-containing protein [Gaiellaceae bacterium]